MFAKNMIYCAELRSFRRGKENIRNYIKIYTRWTRYIQDIQDIYKILSGGGPARPGPVYLVYILICVPIFSNIFLYISYKMIRLRAPIYSRLSKKTIWGAASRTPKGILDSDCFIWEANQPDYLNPGVSAENQICPI